jgi:hypothetical protein
MKKKIRSENVLYYPNIAPRNYFTTPSIILFWEKGSAIFSIFNKSKIVKCTKFSGIVLILTICCSVTSSEGANHGEAVRFKSGGGSGVEGR